MRAVIRDFSLLPSWRRSYLAMPFALLLGACASNVGPTQTVKIDTQPNLAASCVLKNDLGRYRVFETPEQITVTKSTEPLMIRCDAADGRVGEGRVEPRTLRPVWGSAGIGRLMGQTIDSETGKSYRYPDHLRIVIEDMAPRPRIELGRNNYASQRMESDLPLSPVLQAQSQRRQAPQLDSSRGHHHGGRDLNHQNLRADEPVRLMPGQSPRTLADSDTGIITAQEQRNRASVQAEMNAANDYVQEPPQMSQSSAPTEPAPEHGRRQSRAAFAMEDSMSHDAIGTEMDMQGMQMQGRDAAFPGMESSQHGQYRDAEPNIPQATAQREVQGSVRQAISSMPLDGEQFQIPQAEPVVIEVDEDYVDPNMETIYDLEDLPNIEVMVRCQYGGLVVPANRETCARSGGLILDSQ